jgi:hypothetical protein
VSVNPSHDEELRLLLVAAVPSISADCLGWARMAGFAADVDDDAGIVMLWSEAGTRYYIRHRGDRLELSEATPGEDPVLRPELR